MEDREIILLYNQRDEAAIGATMDKYEPYCMEIAFRILADREDAGECVNDTWLRTWNAIPPDQPHSLKLYVGKITRNLSLDRYRAKHREKRGGGNTPVCLEELTELLPDGSDVETEWERKELARALNRCLHELPERECNLFIRRYFYMASTEEIARLYHLKESHVHVILSRVRKKLKEQLEQEGFTR